MHSIVRRLARRLERAVATLTRADASTDEWSADAVEALKRLVRAKQTALLVRDGAGTRVYGDPLPADVLRREAATLPAPTAAAQHFREASRAHAAGDDACVDGPAAGEVFDLVGLVEPTEGRVLVGVCCAFDPPLPRRASATRLRLLRVVQPALASGVRARLAQHAADDVSGRATLVRRFRLTDRECDVALLLQAGRTNLQIADELGISPCTARHHTERVLTKLGIRSRAAIHAAIVDAAATPSPASGGRASRRETGDRALPLHAEGGLADRRHPVSASQAVYAPPRIAGLGARRPTSG